MEVSIAGPKESFQSTYKIQTFRQCTSYWLQKVTQFCNTATLVLRPICFGLKATEFIIIRIVKIYVILNKSHGAEKVAINREDRKLKPRNI